MVIVGAAILAHGTMPFDADDQSHSANVRQRNRQLDPQFRSKLDKLYRGCIQVGEEISAMSPDVIVLHSPHGHILKHSVCLYGNKKAKGTAEWNHQWTEYEVTVDLDRDVMQGLSDHLSKHDIPTEVMVSHSIGVENPLRWGEVVPIWYIQQGWQKKHKDKPVKFVILTSPRFSNWGFDQSLSLGTHLASYLHQLPQKVAVVISGDLSHTYATTCQDPLYLADPRWDIPVDNDSAISFEEAFKNWVLSKGSGSSDWDAGSALSHLQTCAELQPRARSCGINGFHTLHRILEYLSSQGINHEASIEACLAPTYYGLPAAVFKQT